MKRKLIWSTIALTALLMSGCTQKNTPPPANTAQNSGNESGMISETEAKQIALSHAELTSDQVTFIKSGIDRDDDRIYYDVEFYNNDQKEYDYEIEPYTGEVLKYDFDAEYYVHPDGSPENESITADDAKQTALARVPGATIQDIREFTSDYDNGRLQYEGKIYYDEKEYEFAIDGYTNTVLEWDVEPIYGGAS